MFCLTELLNNGIIYMYLIVISRVSKCSLFSLKKGDIIGVYSTTEKAEETIKNFVKAYESVNEEDFDIKTLIYLAVDMTGKFGEGLFALVYQILFYCMALNMVFWILDIFGVLFKTFKIPVVMPDKE